jgi:type II secretory pathway pseudopilin PulG
MSIRRWFQPQNQSGDTIVEVLMVVIVVSVVLSAGYGIAVRSLQSIQLEQERTFALKVAEGQLESLKAAAIKTPNVLANASNYCVVNTNGTLNFPAVGGGSPHVDPSQDQRADYGASCTKDPNGGDCSGYCYMLTVAPDPSNHNYTASVRWDGPRGSRQQVQLSYRIYQ